MWLLLLLCVCEFLLFLFLFLCVQTVVWLPVFVILNVRAGVDACDCTRGLCGHRNRVCTKSEVTVSKSYVGRQGYDGVRVRS